MKETPSAADLHHIAWAMSTKTPRRLGATWPPNLQRLTKGWILIDFEGNERYDLGSNRWPKLTEATRAIIDEAMGVAE